LIVAHPIDDSCLACTFRGEIPMRPRAALLSLLAALAILATACSDGPTGAETTLTITAPSNFVGTVTKVEHEAAYGPAGPYDQYDVWLIVPPGSSPNAGVVVPVRIPIFSRQGETVYTASGSDIHVGDQLEVWRDQTVGYGAVQAPPGAPVYVATQVVIVR